MIYFFVLAVGLCSGVLTGIIGSGSSIMLLPVLVFHFGPQQAVPVMAIAAAMSNIAKLLAWWRDVDWRACAAYSVPGIPAAALGARTLLVLPAHAVDIGLGVFFLVMIPVRYWLAARKLKIRLWQLALTGAVVGFLTGMVLSTGPLSVPAFTAYGLVKGPFLSTEAVSSLALMLSKAVTFQRLGALPTSAMLQGVIIGASVMAGAFLGKAVVRRMKLRTFHLMLDVLLFGSGLALIGAGVG